MDTTPKLEIKPQSTSKGVIIELNPDANFTRLTLEDIKNIGDLSEADYNTLLENKCFSILPSYINSSANDPDNPELLTNRLTTIDYNGLYSKQSNTRYDYLFGGGLRNPENSTDIEKEKYGVNVIKNLNIDRGQLYGGTSALREYYGNIKIDGSKMGGALVNRAVSLFTNSPYFKKAVGEFKAENMNIFSLCIGVGGGAMGAWYNVIDIRNVDTSTCASIALLNYISTPCTLILGNFSNENITEDSAYLLMSEAPDKGRIVVLTTPTPPKLKNCRYDSSLGTYRHSTIYDWVEKGKVNIIYVPKGYRDNYDNDVFIEGSAVGENGWSYYGKYGKNIIVEYDPSKQFLPKKEGGENGRTVWIYRASNKGR